MQEGTPKQLLIDYQPPHTGCYPWLTRCVCLMDATLCVLAGPAQNKQLLLYNSVSISRSHS